MTYPHRQQWPACARGWTSRDARRHLKWVSDRFVVVAEERFTVTYDGLALNTHRMSVDDLAPALLALGEALKETQRLVDPNRDPVRLEIEATSEGSFTVHLVLADGFLEHAVNLLSGRETEATLALGTLIGFLLWLVRLLKRLAGRRPVSQREVDGQTLLTLPDGTELRTQSPVVMLYQSVIVREKLQTFIQPVRNDGIDQATISSPGCSIRTWSPRTRRPRSTCLSFPMRSCSQPSDVNLHLVNVAFEHGKWRVTDGGSSFHVGIADESFLAQVEANEIQFTSGDILKVRLRTSQFRTTGGQLRSEYTVVAVLDHLAGPRQLPIPFDSDPPW